MTTIQLDKPRILILDCNRFELATLADSLRLQSLDVVGQAPDIETARQLFEAINPDAILINLQGCDHGCTELLQELRSLNPFLGIVILTDSPDLRLYGIRQDALPEGSQLIEKSALIDLREIRVAIEIAIKPGTQTGSTVALKGHGMTRLRSNSRGDLIVHIVVMTPTKLTRDQEKLLNDFAKSRGEVVGDSHTKGKNQSFLGKFRDSFGR